MGPDAPYIPIVGQIFEGTGGSGLVQTRNGSAFETTAIKSNLNKIKSDESELLRVELKSQSYNLNSLYKTLK